MLHVLREWQGLAEAGVVGGASAREETAQRGWEHLSWEETGLPRCSPRFLIERSQLHHASGFVLGLTHLRMLPTQRGS